jgi:hypothetical protein
VAGEVLGVNPLDEATVWLMERSSWWDPRDVLRDCAGCGRPFWVHAMHPTQRYCDGNCRSLAWRRAHLVYSRTQERERKQRAAARRERAA